MVNILIPLGYLSEVCGLVEIEYLLNYYTIKKFNKIMEDYLIIFWNDEYIQFRTKKDYELVKSKINNSVVF